MLLEHLLLLMGNTESPALFVKTLTLGPVFLNAEQQTYPTNTTSSFPGEGPITNNVVICQDYLMAVSEALRIDP